MMMMLNRAGWGSRNKRARRTVASPSSAASRTATIGTMISSAVPNGFFICRRDPNTSSPPQQKTFLPGHTSHSACAAGAAGAAPRERVMLSPICG